MKKILALIVLALVLILATGANAGGSVTYSVTLTSITPQPDIQHYGFANINVSFADGKFHQCCDRVAIQTACDNGYAGGGPEKTLWYTTPTPLQGLFYRWDLGAPTVCHSWAVRTTDHNKRGGVASPIITYAVP